MSVGSYRHVFRDRHGRGLRTPMLYPGMPARQTRRQQFESLMARLIGEFIARWPAVETIEFAFEDVPPSDPASWEDHSYVLSRLFPADPKRGLKDRIVVYRLPVTMRAGDDLATMLRHLLLEKIDHVLLLPPDELDQAFHM